MKTIITTRFKRNEHKALVVDAMKKDIIDWGLPFTINSRSSGYLTIEVNSQYKEQGVFTGLMEILNSAFSGGVTDYLCTYEINEESKGGTHV